MGLLVDLRKLIDSGDYIQAKNVALEIERRGYPDFLRKEASDFLNRYGRERQDEDNIFSARLYKRMAESLQPSSTDPPLDWLPRRIIQDAEDVSPDLSLELYLREYHSKGSHVLSYLPRLDIKAIEKRVQPFFDCEHYIASHSDMKTESPAKALHHYAVFGGLEDNRAPNKLFSNHDLYDAYPWTKQIRFNALYLLIQWPEQFPDIAALIIKRNAVTSRSSSLSWLPVTAATSSCRSDDGTSHYSRILALTKEESHTDKLIQSNSQSLKIHFVIPDFTAGGGGHMTIFRLVRFLEQAGHECTVWIKDYLHSRHPEGPQKDAIAYFQNIKAQVHPLSAHYAFSFGDALIATSWDTVEIVKSNQSFHEHFYLVQDYEPLFYARGAEALEAEHTYSLDIKTICASTWLHNIMTTKYGRCSTYFDLSYDPSVYYSREPVVTTKNLSLSRVNFENYTSDKPVIRLAFYARARTARRAVALGLKGLELLKQEKYVVSVELFGELQGVVKLPPNVVGYDHGILSSSELAELYRSCDIGLTFSATNYALVPQEMMACGLPVIEIDNESTRAIYPENILLLAKPTAEAIATAIESLATSPSQRSEIAKQGCQWVQRTSWDNSFRGVEAFIRQHVCLTRHQSFCPTSIQSRYLASPHKILTRSGQNSYSISVVIPTFQGGRLLHDVVANVQAQHGVDPYEIIIIDSSSTDGSIEELAISENMAIVKIDQNTFQHGRTRNLGIALSKSPFVAFLTQDAIPANQNWLASLVKPLKNHCSVDAVFGAHRAHREHPSFHDVNLRNHFKSFEAFPIHSKFQDLRSYYNSNPAFRQTLHYYSDNNSCLRKKAWLLYPYHDVSYGEDQLWADWIIATGRSKAYAAEAVVYHSHHYSAAEEYARSVTESYYFMKYFGYRLGQSRLELETGLEREAQAILTSDDPAVVGQSQHLLDNIRAKREGYKRGCDQYDELIGSAQHLSLK